MDTKNLPAISAKIITLSDTDLLQSTINASKREKVLLAILIEHLAEVERRKLYSDLRYGSLYEYCVAELSYSEDQAYRRVCAMRLAKRHSLIKEKIQSGNISLTNLNLLNGFFKEVKLNKQEQENIVELSSNTSKKNCLKVLSDIRNSKGITEQPKRPFLKQDTADTIRVNVSLTTETITKINNLKSHYAHKHLELPDVIDRMADALIEKNMQTYKSKKRVSAKPESIHQRYIPISLKQKIIERAHNCCELCGSVHALEFDHVKPFAIGGTTTLENMRLLCRNCNTRQGIKSFGVKKMQRAV